MAIAQAAIAMALAILVFTPKMDADHSDPLRPGIKAAPMFAAASSDLLLPSSEQRQ